MLDVSHLAAVKVCSAAEPHNVGVTVGVENKNLECSLYDKVRQAT
jgi:hypothetical protein